jgi:hypothetical protein
MFTIDAFGQITNVKEGLWSDQTVWSNNKIPSGNDDIVLNFDLTIDINASCQSLTLNGHNVIVNTGVNFNVTGNPNSYILSSYVVLDTTAATPSDTTYKIQFYYDSLKRNTVIDQIWYYDGLITDYQFRSSFFYNGNDTLPYLKITTTPFLPDTDWDFVRDTSFYFYSNSIVIGDSSIRRHYTYRPFTTVNKYLYNSAGIIATTTNYSYSVSTENDTVYIQRTNGNITSQIDTTFTSKHFFTFVYDNHPNPFIRTQNKMALNNYYPFYNMETFIEDVFENNNALEINQIHADQFQAPYKFKYKNVYKYKPNGYPKTVWFYDQIVPANFGKGMYFYTN